MGVVDLLESTFPMAVRIQPGEEEVLVALPPGKERRKGAKPRTYFYLLTMAVVVEGAGVEVEVICY